MNCGLNGDGQLFWCEYERVKALRVSLSESQFIFGRCYDDIRLNIQFIYFEGWYFWGQMIYYDFDMFLPLHTSKYLCVLSQILE